MDYLRKVRTAPLLAVVLWTLAAAFATLSEKSVAAPLLTLVESGQAAATIVIPENAPQWTRQGAEWLREYVQKCSGAALTIVSEPDAPAGTRISVGHTKLAKQAGIDLQGLKWDGCRLVARGNVLYLLGLDKAGTKTHDWVGARGTCRAVIKFLEDFCGIRWFLPGPQGELVPETDDVSVPANLDIRFQPAMAYCDGRSVYDENTLNEPGKTIAAQANNYRKGVRAGPGGHTYYGAIPQQQYGETHPEYYALIDGKRRNADWTPDSPYGHHLCSTHPDVRKLLTEYVQMRLDQGLDWMSLGQEDGYLRCQCERCEALDNYPGMTGYSRWEEFQNAELRDNPPERLFRLHHAVAKTVAKTHPDKKIMLMCYAPTAWPSKKIDSFGDNVICEVMNQSPDYLAAWKGKSAGMACYFYLFTIQCPMGFNVSMTPQEIAEKVRYLSSYGMLGIYHGAESNWGLMGPVFYVFGKMMGDPSLSHEDLVEEYCNGVFGAASDTMQEFFDLIYARLEEVVPLGLEDFNGRNTTLPRDMTTTKMFLSQYPPEFLTRLDQLLAQAEQEADSERARGWVRLSREHFDFIKLLTGAMEAHREWKSSETEANWLELKRRVQAFDAFRTKIITYTRGSYNNRIICTCPHIGNINSCCINS